jgi:hypothetical protein
LKQCSCFSWSIVPACLEAVFLLVLKHCSCLSWSSVPARNNASRQAGTMLQDKQEQCFKTSRNNASRQAGIMLQDKQEQCFKTSRNNASRQAGVLKHCSCLSWSIVPACLEALFLLVLKQCSCLSWSIVPACLEALFLLVLKHCSCLSSFFFIISRFRKQNSNICYAVICP